METQDLWPIQSRTILREKGINPKSLKKLGAIFPWNPQYTNQKSLYSLRMQISPLIIFNPETTLDLENIFNFIKEYSLTVSMLGGRGSTQLNSPEVAINMNKFKKLEVDKNILIAGACTTQGEISSFLENNKYKYILTSATTLSTGSITTIGGSTFLKRTYGLTIDSAKSYKITIPPTNTELSKTLTVTKNRYPDLFYALQGGNACNFGIVSEVKSKLIKIGQLLSYRIDISPNDLKKKLKIWKDTATSRSFKFNETFYVTSTNGINLNFIIGYYVLSEDNIKDSIKIIKKELAPLSLNIKFDLISYDTAFRDNALLLGFDVFNLYQAIFVYDFDVEYIYNKINDVPTGGTVFFVIELMGGVIKSKNRDVSFPYKDTNFYIVIGSKWSELQYSQDFNNYMFEIMKHYLDENQGIYSGFPISFNNLPNKGDIYYKQNYSKLLQIKEKYDSLQILTPTGCL